MGGIFWGCFMILLDLAVIPGRTAIAVMGGCAGCAVLMMGVGELAGKSAEFDHAGKLSAVLIFDLVLAALFGRFGMGNGEFLNGMEITDAVITALLQILVLKMVTMGIRDVEEQNRIDLGGVVLGRAWKWLAILQVITVLSMIAPVFPAFMNVLAFAMTVIFLVELYRVTRRYRRWEESI